MCVRMCACFCLRRTVAQAAHILCHTQATAENCVLAAAAHSPRVCRIENGKIMMVLTGHHPHSLIITVHPFLLMTLTATLTPCSQELGFLPMGMHTSIRVQRGGGRGGGGGERCHAEQRQWGARMLALLAPLQGARNDQGEVESLWAREWCLQGSRSNDVGSQQCGWAKCYPSLGQSLLVAPPCCLTCSRAKLLPCMCAQPSDGCPRLNVLDAHV